MGTFGCGVTGLSFGGASYAWYVLTVDCVVQFMLTDHRNSAAIIALLVVSIVLLIAFGIQQVWCLGTSRANRLLPVQYFGNRTLFLMFVLNTLAAAPIFVPVYFLSLYFQFARGDTAVDAAVRLLPFMCMVVFFSLLNGAVMGKKGYYAPWFLAASAIAIVGSTLMFTVDEFTSVSRINGYSALLGAGAGSVVQTGFIVAQAVVPRAEMSSGKHDGTILPNDKVVSRRQPAEANVCRSGGIHQLGADRWPGSMPHLVKQRFPQPRSGILDECSAHGVQE